MDAFDELAEALRRRLIERARRGEAGDNGGLAVEVRALVDSEAAALPDGDREALAARVVRLATGLGPLEPLLSDPRVDGGMGNGPGGGEGEGRGGGVGRARRPHRADERAVRVRGRAHALDRADPGAARPARGRGVAPVRRAAAGRVA